MNTARNGKFSVGLTGGIGCGKTTVSDIFAELGAAVIDTDQIAHALTTPHGAAMPALLAQFGPGFATAEGALDRAKMRALVFDDAAARQRLEAILHPLIREATSAAAAAAVGPYLVFVVPLLIESGNWRARFDRVLVIDCAEQTRIARVMARSGLPEEQVKAIMATQAPRAARLAAADDVVANDDGIVELRPQIERLHGIYMAISERMAGLPMQRL